jgi:long-chain acyl-CoA synthetase
MPYHRWLEIAHRYATCPALYEGEQVLSFADLAAMLAARPLATAPVIARSGSADFLVEILRAWRDGQPVIPVERNAAEPILAQLPSAEICLIKHTPGASGISRGIFFTAAQMMADADRIVAAMGLTPAMPNLSVISLAHSYGFSNVALPLLLHGVPIHLAATPFPRAIEEIFAKHPGLVVPAVPSMWRAWHRAGILKGAPIALAISAGAPLTLALEREIFEASGLKIHNFYGASECGGISWGASLEPRDSAADLGMPLPGVSISTDAAGRIRVRSSSVASRYEVPDEESALSDDCYLTRDLGHLDVSGKLFLTGSIGGAINVAGRKVSPAKIEAALLATGIVQSAKAYGVPSRDAERVQEIAVEIRLSPGRTLDSLKTAAAERLATWEQPRHWIV